MFYKLKTDVKLAVRNLLRDRTYGVVSIVGLSLALACAILVWARAVEEYRHVEHYRDGDRIYRILRQSVHADGGAAVNDWVNGGATVALRTFPEVELAARATASLFTRSWHRVGEKTRHLFFCRADPELIELLELSFLKGGLETGAMTAVVTARVAADLFGTTDPIGRTLTLLEGSAAGDYRITGILEEVPPYAHIRIDVMTAAPPSSVVREDYETWSAWNAGLRGPKNYLRLAVGADPTAVEDRLNDVMRRSVPEESSRNRFLRLQPMSRAHLYGEQEFGRHGESPIAYLRLLVLVTIAVVGVACANFVNLSAARIVARTREVATQRALGAGRGQVFARFLVESMVVSLLSLALAYALAVEAPFTRVFGDTLTIASLTNPRILFGMVAIALAVGLVAGFYPAVVAARIRPVGSGAQVGVSRSVRNVLIVGQVGCAAFFIIGASVIHDQTDYWRTADLGIDSEQVLTTRFIFIDEHRGKQEMVKAAFERILGVVSATAMWPGPGAGEKPGRKVTVPSDPLTEHAMRIQGADEDFLQTYGIDLIAGRNLGPDFAPKDNAEFLLNETAVRRLGWTVDDAIGQALTVGAYRGTVIGVVKDYHQQSLQHPIQPMVLLNWSRIALAVRIRPERTGETIEQMRETFGQFFDQPPVFAFVEDWFNRFYSRQVRQGRSFAILSWTAVFLAGLGVFGVAAFETEQRRREVGVRKVLGASITDIVTMFWSHHAKLVLVGNAIAWPIGYWMMSRWLSDFAYRVDLSAAPFVIAAVTTGLVFLTVVGSLAVKIGRVDPAATLRSE